MKIGVIIQARMGSTRLPGKVMKIIKEKTILEHVIKRINQSLLVDDIIVATSINNKDDIIEKESLKHNVKVFRGSEEDVLSRYYFAAKQNKLDIVIRITSDCPLIDSKIIDKMIDIFINNNYDIITNDSLDPLKHNFPRGMDVEIFSFNKLIECYNNAKEDYQREHVTPYIYENSKKVYYYECDTNYSKYRLTLDTEDDFKLIETIYNRLYNGKHDFYLEDIIELFQAEPELYLINNHIKQKSIK